MSTRYLLAVTTYLALAMAVCIRHWPIGVFFAGFGLLAFPSFVSGRGRAARAIRYALLAIAVTSVYSLSYGPVVAIDEFLTGTSVHDRRYGRQTSLASLFPVHRSVYDSRPQVGLQAAARVCLFRYERGWRDMGWYSKGLIHFQRDRLGLRRRWRSG